MSSESLKPVLVIRNCNQLYLQYWRKCCSCYS